MAHTGIRLRVNVPGGPALIEGDSDWLHMAAIFAGGPLNLTAEMVTEAPPEQPWHQVMGGSLEIWVQAVMLPDEYPDDDA